MSMRFKMTDGYDDAVNFVFGLRPAQCKDSELKRTYFRNQALHHLVQPIPTKECLFIVRIYGCECADWKEGGRRRR